MSDTTLDALFAPTERSGDGGARLLLVDGAARLLGADLGKLVATTAGWLAGQGVVRGDPVAFQLPNSWEAVVLYRACWRLGAVAAPLHHLAGPADVAAITDRLRPRVTVGPDARLTELVAGAAPVTEDRALPADVAVVLHTSGSSGTPKGVLHTHRVLASKARTMVGVHRLGADDVVLMPAPLAHVSGLLNGILVPGAGRFRSVLMARWNPVDALRTIEEEQVSFMVGPPTFFLGLEAARGFTPEKVRSLRLVSAGGAGVTPAFVERTARLFGAVVKRSYGSTEAPTVTTSTTDDDGHAMATTDGRPVGAMEVRTVDPVTGTVVDAGTPGEIQVRGPELFAGYTDPFRTVEVMDGDWFRTGDLGVLDDRGRLTVVGRLADVIIRGGENISAAEVETHLEAHPAVAHAVAVPEPDDRLGERVCAFVTLAPDAAGFDLEDCRAWFSERGVARFRTPERVVVLADLPVLASGKADRALLRRRAADAGPT